MLLPTRPTSRPATFASAPRRGALTVALIVLIVLLAMLLIGGACAVNVYNGLASRREAADARWSDVDSQYKRRYDLIPNLVETVKGAANFEQQTLAAVTEARAKVGQAQLPSNLPSDEKQMQSYIAAQQGLSSALGRLFSVVENYPELKANQNFLALQSQIEGTENRVQVARKDYIDAVQAYNTRLATFPGNVLGGLFHFEKRTQWSAAPEERENPKVDFGKK